MKQLFASFFLLFALLAASLTPAAQTRPPALSGSLKQVHDKFVLTSGFRFTHVKEERKAGKWTAVTYAGEAIPLTGARFTMSGAGPDDGTWLMTSPSYGQFKTYRSVGATWHAQPSPAADAVRDVLSFGGLPGFGTVQKLAPETVDSRACAHYRVTDAPNISDLWVDEAKGQLVRFDLAQPGSNYRYRTIYHQVGLTPTLPAPK